MALRTDYPESIDRNVILLEWSYFDMLNCNNIKLSCHFSVMWFEDSSKISIMAMGKN